MIVHLARRLAFSLATIAAAVVLCFFLIRLTPGTPGELILGAGASKADIAAKNTEIGWDRPVWTQLGDYLTHLLRADFGTSIINGHDIGADLLTRLPVTAAIAILAAVLSLVVGMSLGLLAIVRGGTTDRIVNGGTGVSLSLPPFWIGIVLVYFVAIRLHWVPATGYHPPSDGLELWAKSIVLPVVALAIPSAAIVGRTARVALTQALGQPHIQMLRVMGTPPSRSLLLHTVRSASVPVVSVLGVQFMGLFSGSVIVEGLFALPGLGQAASNAITSYDVPAVEGVVILSAIVIVAVNFFIDLLVAAIDPRIRAR